MNRPYDLIPCCDFCGSTWPEYFLLIVSKDCCLKCLKRLESGEILYEKGKEEKKA